MDLGWVTLPETNSKSAPESLDAWNTMKFPFGARPIFRGELLVSGRVSIWNCRATPFPVTKLTKRRSMEIPYTPETTSIFGAFAAFEAINQRWWWSNEAGIQPAYHGHGGRWLLPTVGSQKHRVIYCKDLMKPFLPLTKREFLFKKPFFQQCELQTKRPL